MISGRITRKCICAFTPIVFLLIAGCASFSKDGGFSTVQSLVKERSGQEAKKVASEADNAEVKAILTERLKKPLTVNDAVTIAILNNKGLQASYNQLGIAEADVVQAGRLKNPTFSFEKLRQGNDVEYDRTLTTSLFDLMVIPAKVKIENRYFEQTKIQAASDTLRVIDETRLAYFSTVAAQQSVNYREQVKSAADASTELAGKMVAAGNWTTLQQADEQAFASETNAQLIRAKQTYNNEREKLTRLLGLSGEDIHFKLPNRLPEIPKKPQDIKDAESQAMKQRLDLMMAKQELAGLADSLGLTKQTRFINLLDVSYLNNSFNNEAHQTGYAIEFEIPLFDWGTAKVAKAETLYMQAVNKTADMAVNAQSEVRDAYFNYRTSYDLAKHYRDEVVPLQKRISDEKMLRYNGMFISVFDLLKDAQDQAAIVNAAIDAQRDFWLSDSALHMALMGSTAEQPISNSAAISTDSIASSH